MRRVFVDADRHDSLELPDGRLAAKLRLESLRQELLRLQIDGLEPQMGKVDLLDCYRAAVDKVADELRSINDEKPFKATQMPQETMREAVAFIERQAQFSGAA